MDTLQLTFKESYVRTLRSNIKVENYLGTEFPYDHNMVRRVAGVIQPKDLDKKLDPNDNYKSAIALFEAYQDISLLVASSEPFWVYLAHVDLFNCQMQRIKLNIFKIIGSIQLRRCAQHLWICGGLYTVRSTGIGHRAKNMS